MTHHPSRHHFDPPQQDPPTIFGILAVLMIMALIALGLLKAAELLLPWLLHWTQ